MMTNCRRGAGCQSRNRSAGQTLNEICVAASPFVHSAVRATSIVSTRDCPSRSAYSLNVAIEASPCAVRMSGMLTHAGDPDPRRPDREPGHAGADRSLDCRLWAEGLGGPRVQRSPCILDAAKEDRSDRANLSSCPHDG